MFSLASTPAEKEARKNYDAREAKKREDRKAEPKGIEMMKPKLTIRNPPAVKAGRRHRKKTRRAKRRV